MDVLTTKTLAHARFIANPTHIRFAAASIQLLGNCTAASPADSRIATSVGHSARNAYEAIMRCRKKPAVANKQVALDDVARTVSDRFFALPAASNTT